MERDGKGFFDRVIGHHLRHRRIELGLSQREVAEAIGVSRQLYARYERGLSRIGQGTLNKLSKFLRVTLERLYAGITSAIAAAGFADGEQARYASKPLAAQSKELDLAFRRIRDPRIREHAIEMVGWLADHDEASRDRGKG
ncbi:helix-turn-helix domain-containing protein [Bosea vestrisii]|uniref:helix-turn-helix domain-containing protein n=1 Tax=Bosea vestrisii TaxID=151416 RepID=UPI0024DF5691|nr:helix-turn-helix domain-containing protein [Bosea vestrisii]WID94273.1 helix-turn-helix domain-containing protein [Bosea vestrisii]